MTLNFFNSSYDYYYLFLESEIRNNASLGRNVFNLNNERYNIINHVVNIPFLTEVGEPCQIIIPLDYNSQIQFYDIEYNIGNAEFNLFMFDYNVHDDSYQWEIYSSERRGFAIFGCSNDLDKKLKQIFRPYQDLDINEKYKVIEFENSNNFGELKSVLEENFKLTETAERT